MNEEMLQISNDISEKWLAIITHYLRMFGNDTVDFKTPHLRKSLRNIYPVFVFLYGLVAIVGTLGNVCVLGNIVRRRLYRDPTYWFLGNVAFSDLVKCVLVLPVTLANLTIQNWVFGSFLCSFLPMLQHIPINASMLMFLLIAVDRYRVIMYPMKARMPPFICAMGVWVLSICAVLPFMIYLTYLDLEPTLGQQFEGTGICLVNVEEDMEEYLRGLFIALYVLPLTIIAFLYLRVSGEIKSREHPMSVVYFENSSVDVRTHSTTLRSASVTCDTAFPQRPPIPDNVGNHGHCQQQLDTCQTDQHQAIIPSLRGQQPSPRYVSEPSRDGWESVELDGSGGSGSVARTIGRTQTSLKTADYEEEDFDPAKEKRIQKYLIMMVTMFATCLCPLNILHLVRHIVTETYDNSSHFDMTYIILVWIGFLPTCTTPALFASWQMSRPTKDRLRGYFRFSDKRRRAPSSENAPSYSRPSGHNNKAFYNCNGVQHAEHKQLTSYLTASAQSQDVQDGLHRQSLP